MSGRFEALSESLLLRGIAPNHVHRYARELEEHFADLVNEEMERGLARLSAEIRAEERIGRTEDLVEAMAVRKELRSWIGRMPRTILIGGPVLTLLLFHLLQLAGVIAIIESFGYVGNGHVVPPLWLRPFFHWGFGFDNFLLPIMLGWAFGAAARRQRIGKEWMLTGLLLLAVVSGPIFLRYHWPADLTDFSLGYGSPSSAPILVWIDALTRGVVNFVLTAGPCWFYFDPLEKA